MAYTNILTVYKLAVEKNPNNLPTDGTKILVRLKYTKVFGILFMETGCTFTYHMKLCIYKKKKPIGLDVTSTFF